MSRIILDALVSRNPVPNTTFVTGGSNTASQGWIPVDSWQPWTDFTYDSLLSLYGDALRSTGDPPKLEPASDYDQEIWDEHSLDLFLAKFMLPVINWALRRATKAMGRGDEVLYLGPGSWTGHADWSLVSHHRMASDPGYWCLLPGDTKLPAKWQPIMERSHDEHERYQWTLPVSQVNTYAAEAGRRYGFIISDMHLVVLRVSKEAIAQGSAMSRPERHLQPSHQRIASSSTDISSHLESMSLGSSYVNDDLIDGEYLPPEYAVIPWLPMGKDD